MIRKAPTYPVLFVLLLVILTAACTGRNPQSVKESRQPQDTVYTQQAAMAIYDYDPVRALQIIDSAVIVGNLSEVWGDFCRARIYGQSQMGERLDSMLGGPERLRVGAKAGMGVHFDSARAIGERLLLHDSLKTNLGLHQNVLELLVYVARQQNDTTAWLQRSRELVGVCRQQGAETEALRTEAELGASLCYTEQQAQGMARLDSVIGALGSLAPFRFNELDAFIIASKRKIGVLSNRGQYVETLPLARRIIELLDDYEQHPDKYHDGTYREPPSDRRADYICFYRSQTQGFITAGYTALGDKGNMTAAYEKIERTVRDATASEHIARYHALEQQMLRQEAESRSRMMTFVAIASALGLLLILVFAALLLYQNLKIRKKNHVLAKLIEEQNRPSPESSDNRQLFTNLDSAIRSERLYANPTFQRQDACDHFNLRREVLNQLLTDYANGQSFPTYINRIRLSEACRLLAAEPDKTVNAIAEEVGLSPRNLRRLFVDQYGMAPTEYRQGLQNP